MSWEAVTALATAGTFVVILATAIAALKQLRHTRNGNQIVALAEFRETFQSPEFVDARHFITSELPKRLEDNLEAERASTVPFIGEYQAIGYVANFFDGLGLFVKHRIIDEELVCESFGYVVVSTWEALVPVLTCVRQRSNIDFWGSFEYLASRADEFNRKRGGIYTTYPANVARMPSDTSLYDRIVSHEPKT